MTKILTVDQDTDVLRLLRIKLGAAGYAVTRARDGQEALAALQATADARPDVVITELLLPDMAGNDLIAQLAMLPVPPLIVVLSSLDSDAAIAAALAAGATDYVTKPFSPQALLERVRVNLMRAGQGAQATAEG